MNWVFINGIVKHHYHVFNVPWPFFYKQRSKVHVKC